MIFFSKKHFSLTSIIFAMMQIYNKKFKIQTLQPLFLFENIVCYKRSQDHQPQRRWVTPHVIQLWHHLEVHTINTCDKHWWHKKHREYRKYFNYIILLNIYQSHRSVLNII